VAHIQGTTQQEALLQGTLYIHNVGVVTEQEYVLVVMAVEEIGETQVIIQEVIQKLGLIVALAMAQEDVPFVTAQEDFNINNKNNINNKKQ